MWRSGIRLQRFQTAAARGENGKLDPADVERADHSAFRHPLSEAKVVSVTQATELARSIIWTICTPAGTGRPVPAENPYGRRALRQRGGVAGRDPGATDLAIWRGCAVSGGTKNGWRSARRFCSSTESWRPISPGAASRPVSLPPRCASSRRPGWNVGNRGLAAERPSCQRYGGLSRTAVAGCRSAPDVPRQANSVFLELPPHVIESLRAKGWQFYTFIGVGGVRLMCSWNTSLEAVEQFIGDLEQALAC